jgi:hypothetical protein
MATDLLPITSEEKDTEDTEIDVPLCILEAARGCWGWRLGFGDEEGRRRVR